MPQCWLFFSSIFCHFYPDFGFKKTFFLAPILTKKKFSLKFLATVAPFLVHYCPILALNFNFRPNSLKFHILALFLLSFIFSFFIGYFWPIFGSKTPNLGPFFNLNFTFNFWNICLWALFYPCSALFFALKLLFVANF